MSKDWHPADIVAALRKRGVSYKSLSIQNGLHPNSVAVVGRRPWMFAERIVADALGVEPWEIWPSRYSAKSRVRRRLCRAGEPFEFDRRRPRSNGKGT